MVSTLPPAKITKVPFQAPAVPPETGESIQVTCFCAASTASCLVLSTDKLENQQWFAWVASGHEYDHKPLVRPDYLQDR